MNQQPSVNLQGLGGGAVLFLVDGERLAGETVGNIDYSRLQLSDIERIEVVKGGSSALYGAGAAAAVVNIITRRDSRSGLELDSRVGAHSLLRHSLVANLVSQRWRSTTTAQADHTDAIHLADSGDLTTLLAHSSASVHERLTVDASDRLSLSARASYHYHQRHAANPASDDDRYRDLAAGLRAELRPSDADRLSLAYSYDEYDKSAYSHTTALDLLNYSNVQHTLRALATHTADALELVAGAELARDYLMSYQLATPHRQLAAAAFAQGEWSPSRRLTLLAALRLDHYAQLSLTELSPRLALMLRPSDALTLRAALARGFRAPTLKERFMDFDMAGIFVIRGNPDLAPERANTATLSAEYARTHLNLAATAFLSHTESQIGTVWDQATASMIYRNLDDATTAGVDLAAQATLDCGLHARAAYTFTHLADRGPTQLAVVRPHSATLQIGYSRANAWGTLSASLSGRLLSAVRASVFSDIGHSDATTGITYPAYTLWKLTLAQQTDAGLDISLTVDNLFNYTPATYYNNSPTTTGLTLLAGLTLDVRRLCDKLCR